MKKNNFDWWKTAAGTTILIGMYSVYEYMLVDDLFNTFFTGGIQIALGLWLWKKSKNALYVMWFLLLLGLAALAGGYESSISDEGNALVTTALNITQIISLIMLSVQVSRQSTK